MMRRIKSGKQPEVIVFFLFIVLYCLITAYHEPWFDEAQAWQIAKCASIKDIIFTIPHYEGHPPLWHLILAIPAKMGLPFEVGLKAVGGIISAISAYIIIFRSRFPQGIRLMLPFSYWVFYQYGVIVRPYGLMLLAFLLLGFYFEYKDTHPFLFSGLLAFLCLTGAYGILFAGGIAICQVLEIWTEKGTQRFFCELFKDRRTQSLGFLLLFAICLLSLIVPRSDTLVVTPKESSNTLSSRLFCALLTFFTDCLFYNNIWFSHSYTILQNTIIPEVYLIPACVVGLFIWLLLISTASKKNLKYLLLPYILFAIFSAIVYFCIHHVGLAYLFLIFWAEICASDQNRFEIGKAFTNIIVKTNKDIKLIKAVIGVILFASIFIPIYWTSISSFHEFKNDYCYGRSIYSFLEGYKLTGLKAYSSFEGEPKKSDKVDDIEPQENIYLNINWNSLPVLINAYARKNVCLNLNSGSDNEAYSKYQTVDKQTGEEIVAAWKSAGVPDLLFGRPSLKWLYGDGLTYDDYSLVYVAHYSYVWKNELIEWGFPVFIRTDLLSKYGLTKLDTAKYPLYVGFTVTDEMKEQFENGVPTEEILKPYLDAIFGEE